MVENENAEASTQESEATEQTVQKSKVTEEVSKEPTEAATEETKKISDIYKMEDEEKKSTEEKKEEVEEKKEPVEYGDFEIPEGMKLSNEQQMEQFKEVAKDLGLDKDGAQKLVNMRAEMIKQDMAASEAQITKQREEWDKEIKTDTTYGGTNLNATIESGSLALRSVDSGEAFGKLLKDVGIENNPDAVKFMADIGKKLQEDQIIDGKAPGAVDTRSILDKRYPTMPD